MATDARPASLPWQPLTFGGVAAFASGPFRRLFAIVLIVAVLVAASVVAVFYLAWEPAVRQAIARLPEEGAIRAGRLDWIGPTPVRLCEGKFLSLIVDSTGTGELGHAADLQCELGRTELRLRSILGFVGLPYPTQWVIELNRRALEPWWGAWHLVVAAGLAAGAVLGLFVSWGILGALYALPAQVIAVCSDRRVGVIGAWRLAVASHMPGALLMSAAIFAYGFQQLNLIQLLAAWLIHVALTWIYVVISPLCLPRISASSGSSSPKRNPFRESADGRSA